ncbi:MAG: exonuclease domain-containing protein, partial [Verrucomicrobiota bacterium]
MEPITTGRVYLWFDTEFTDLNPDISHLLQVALVATDARMQRLVPPEDDLNLIVQLEDDAYLSPWVKDNLAPLLGRCRSDEAVGVAEVDRQLAAYVDRVAGPVSDAVNRRPVLAGNSVYADLVMAKKWLPEFARRLHYRLLDVSTLKTLWEDTGGETFDKDDALLMREYFPGDSADFSGKPHDADYDILASMAEL